MEIEFGGLAPMPTSCCLHENPASFAGGVHPVPAPLAGLLPRRSFKLQVGMVVPIYPLVSGASCE